VIAAHHCSQPKRVDRTVVAVLRDTWGPVEHGV
jgi:hypothetical protein